MDDAAGTGDAAISVDGNSVDKGDASGGDEGAAPEQKPAAEQGGLPRAGASPAPLGGNGA
jgi:hypothetical protein